MTSCGHITLPAPPATSSLPIPPATATPLPAPPAISTTMAMQGSPPCKATPTLVCPSTAGAAEGPASPLSEAVAARAEAVSTACWAAAGASTAAAAAVAAAATAASPSSPASLLLTANTRVAAGWVMKRHASNRVPNRGLKAEEQCTKHLFSLPLPVTDTLYNCGSKAPSSSTCRSVRCSWSVKCSRSVR